MTDILLIHQYWAYSFSYFLFTPNLKVKSLYEINKTISHLFCNFQKVFLCTAIDLNIMYKFCILDFQIVEFVTVLLETGSEAAEKELIRSGAINGVLDLFFE